MARLAKNEWILFANRWNRTNKWTINNKEGFLVLFFFFLLCLANTLNMLKLLLLLEEKEKNNKNGIMFVSTKYLLLTKWIDSLETATSPRDRVRCRCLFEWDFRAANMRRNMSLMSRKIKCLEDCITCLRVLNISFSRLFVYHGADKIGLNWRK